MSSGSYLLRCYNFCVSLKWSLTHHVIFSGLFLLLPGYFCSLCVLTKQYAAKKVTGTIFLLCIITFKLWLQPQAVGLKQLQCWLRLKSQAKSYVTAFPVIINLRRFNIELQREFNACCTCGAYVFYFLFLTLCTHDGLLSYNPPFFYGYLIFYMVAFSYFSSQNVKFPLVCKYIFIVLLGHLS